MIRNWFRRQRSLVGQLDEFEAIVAKQVDEIATLRDEMSAGWQRATDDKNRLGGQIRTQSATIAAQSAQLATVREELSKLRDEIAAAERAAVAGIGIHPNLRSGTGPGMARLVNQPMPWQTADAIAQDDVAKRAADQ